MVSDHFKEESWFELQIIQSDFVIMDKYPQSYNKNQNCERKVISHKMFWTTIVLFIEQERKKKNELRSSGHSSMVSMAACYWGSPGFKSWQGQKFINFRLKRKFIYKLSTKVFISLTLQEICTYWAWIKSAQLRPIKLVKTGSKNKINKLHFLQTRLCTMTGWTYILMK